MSIRSHIPVDIALLGKYLSGEAAPEEAMAIDDWVANDTENRRLFSEVKQLWEQAASGTGYHFPEKELAMRELQQSLEKSNTAKKSLLRKIFSYKSVAAVVMLLAGTTVLYYFLRENKTTPQLSEITKTTTADISRDTLPDRSIVVLNSYTQLKYGVAFNQKDRQLQLRGQAWFDVTPDVQKAFVIRVGDIHIKVLGTAFNVQQDSSKIEATVKSGSILMYKDNETIAVKAGQKGTYLVSSGQFTVSDTVNMNIMSYATREFSFENVTLKEIVTALGKAYHVKIVIENEKLESCRMSSSFHNQPLQYILDVISITLNVECRKDRNVVYISGVACS